MIAAVPEVLDALAAGDPDRPVLAAGAERRRLADLRSNVALTAARLAREGLEPGERLAVMAGSRPELLELVLACGWLGAVAVPVHTGLRGQQLEHVLSNSGARLLVVERQLAAALAGLRRPLALERCWLLDGGDAAPRGWDAVPVPSGPVEAAVRHPVRAGDLAAIVYTSGTTGPAKGVRVLHGQLRWWGRNLADLMAVRDGDVLTTCLPLFHINALATCLAALEAGAVAHLVPRFSASGFWQTLVDTGATATFLIGPMAVILAGRPAGPLDRAHRVRAALAPGTAPELHAVFRDRFGIALVDAYGSTETNCVLGDPPGEGRPGWMGRPRTGFGVRVAGADGTEVGDGQVGELLVRHDEPFAMADGYHGLPDKSVEAWRDLWFHTGDAVVRDGDGRLRFVDRLKDAIRRRGENVSAHEVEQALLTHPAVAAAAAFAVPGELGDDDVMAAVVLERGLDAGPPAIVEHLRPRLAAFAIPRYVEVVAELPLTPTGRVRKDELRRRGVTPATWDQQAVEASPRS